MTDEILLFIAEHHPTPSIQAEARRLLEQRREAPASNVRPDGFTKPVPNDARPGWDANGSPV